MTARETACKFLKPLRLMVMHGPGVCLTLDNGVILHSPECDKLTGIIVERDEQLLRPMREAGDRIAIAATIGDCKTAAAVLREAVTGR